jgi:hypothetical protein
MFSLATDAAPGRPNEDFAIVTPNLTVVVDGVGVPLAGATMGSPGTPSSSQLKRSPHSSAIRSYRLTKALRAAFEALRSFMIPRAT